MEVVHGELGAARLRLPGRAIETQIGFSATQFKTCFLRPGRALLAPNSHCLHGRRINRQAGRVRMKQSAIEMLAGLRLQPGTCQRRLKSIWKRSSLSWLAGRWVLA